MVSSKGKPTDPKLREEAKEDVKQMTNKDGSGKGQMAAWKASITCLFPSLCSLNARLGVAWAGKISQEYEKRGGDYENEAGSKNEPTKGAPKAKSDEKKNSETKDAEKAVEKKDDKPNEKPKANTAKKATDKKESKPKTSKKEKQAPTEGTRKSTRVSQKRSAPADEERGKKAPVKKTKTAKK